MTVSEQIIQVLNYLGGKFGIAIDWTSENVIPYVTTLCEKLITYEIWTSVAWMAITTILSIIAIILSIKFRIFSLDFLEAADLAGGFLMIGFVILWGFTLVCIGTQIFDIIKCVTFPEMYVFEYVQGLINGGANG